MTYIDKQRFLEVLLPDLKLNPQFDIGVGQRLTKKGRIITDKTKALLFFYLLEVKFLVAKDYLVARLLLVYNLKEFALFGLIAHVVPHADRPTLLKRPSHFLGHFKSFSSIEIDVRIEFRVFRGLLIEQNLTITYLLH